MISSRSNIKESLNKKKRASLRKKLFWLSFLVLVLISLVLWGLTSDKIKIKDIKVVGNNSITTDAILQLVNPELSKKYLWFIPTNNLFLLRKDAITENILTNLKKVNSVDVSIKGLTSIEVSIKERESKNLWCKDRDTNPKKCYFLDPDGFIFEEAPTFSGDSFPEYFGLVTSTQPIGQYYARDNFKDLVSLFSSLANASFSPKQFVAVSSHEYEVYILGGGKILINDKKSFESSIANLQALVTNGYIKTDDASLAKIKYIDLRFGNKVNFELK